MHPKQMFRIITGILAIMALTLILGGSARAAGQYKTIHRFNKQTGVRGRAPYGGLTIDAAGNLYGTTQIGGRTGSTCGRTGCGVVFELTPNGDGSWTKTVLHSFNGGSDGATPIAGVIVDAAGNLYGTTRSAGAYGAGTVFELTPNGVGSWVHTVLHSFSANGSDGEEPRAGLAFDAAGNLYGTTYYGGAYGVGTVFELTPNGDGSWTESVLHSFRNYYGSEGAYPSGALIVDASGNLYGTTTSGGTGGDGTVFELTPNGDGSWTESVLHLFKVYGEGGPQSSLIFDASGNLYGTTSYGGAWHYGTVIELTPNGDGSWTESVLYSFNGSDGQYPYSSLIFDAAGNLCGTASAGGSYGYGVVFKLRPTLSGTWRFRVLHNFMGTPGAYPHAGLVLDQTGNLYGTTYGDGKTTFGSVYEITP